MKKRHQIGDAWTWVAGIGVRGSSGPRRRGCATGSRLYASVAGKQMAALIGSADFCNNPKGKPKRRKI